MEGVESAGGDKRFKKEDLDADDGKESHTAAGNQDDTEVLAETDNAINDEKHYQPACHVKWQCHDRCCNEVSFCPAAPTTSGTASIESRADTAII